MENVKIKQINAEIARNSVRIDSAHRKSNIISWIRLVLVAGAIIIVVISSLQKADWGYIPAAVLVAGFIVLIRIHSKVDKEEEYYTCKQSVLMQRIGKIDGKWTSSDENGEEFKNSDIPQIKDLDIFGDNSLFQYVTEANTPYGRAELAKMLTVIAPDYDSVSNRQAAVRELVDKAEFKNEILTLGKTIGSNRIFKNKSKNTWEKEIKGFEKTVSSTSGNVGSIWKVLMWLMPILTFTAIVLAVLNVAENITLPAAIILPLAQLLGTSINNAKNSKILVPVYSFCESASVYKNIFTKISAESFESSKLNDIKNTAIDGLEGFKALSEIQSAVSMRYGLMYLIVNGLFMWDYHCLARFDLWKIKYGAKVSAWLTAEGELEALISLSDIYDAAQVCCFPKIMAEGTQVHFTNLHHPLIPSEKSVGNSIDLKSRTCVITGSNMSGKTTFLRSIGTNLILCYAGAPVMAESFSASCMRLFTSMRVEDDVSRGISTFYAEILRIKSMVEYSATRMPMISLIDEIFKGTNSADRIVGAEQTLRKISIPTNITVVSTHDFELCNLENDPRINAINYHFSEYYENNEIHFEYKLREGRCKTTNAQYLLQMSGINS